MSPVIRLPSAGLMGICPAQNSRSPTRTAWLYGPTAVGDFAGLMICLVAINFGEDNSTESYDSQQGQTPDCFIKCCVGVIKEFPGARAHNPSTQPSTGVLE